MGTDQSHHCVQRTADAAPSYIGSIEGQPASSVATGDHALSPHAHGGEGAISS